MIEKAKAALERARQFGIGKDDYEALKEVVDRATWRPISEIHEDNGDHVAYSFETEEMELVHNCSADFKESDWDICVPAPYLSHYDVSRLKAEAECPACQSEQTAGMNICSGRVGRGEHTCGKK